MARLRLQSLEGRELMSAAIDGLTAPVGSTSGSVVAEFTPPIGSDKGSFTARIAGDGIGTALPRSSSQGIIAILIG